MMLRSAILCIFAAALIETAAHSHHHKKRSATVEKLHSKLRTSRSTVSISGWLSFPNGTTLRANRRLPQHTVFDSSLLLRDLFRHPVLSHLNLGDVVFGTIHDNQGGRSIVARIRSPSGSEFSAYSTILEHHDTQGSHHIRKGNLAAIIYNDGDDEMNKETHHSTQAEGTSSQSRSEPLVKSYGQVVTEARQDQSVIGTEEAHGGLYVEKGQLGAYIHGSEVSEVSGESAVSGGSVGQSRTGLVEDSRSSERSFDSQISSSGSRTVEASRLSETGRSANSYASDGYLTSQMDAEGVRRESRINHSAASSDTYQTGRQSQGGCTASPGDNWVFRSRPCHEGEQAHTLVLHDGTQITYYGQPHRT